MQTKRTFVTMAERDRFIDENYPKRKGGHVPGFYRLPNGDQLIVSMNTVTLHTADENDDINMPFSGSMERKD